MNQAEELQTGTSNLNPLEESTILQPSRSEEHLIGELKGPHEIDWNNDKVGEWCVVKYDNELYPGIIMAKDEGYVQVKCMSHAGKNRFFWRIRDDSIWYMFDVIIRLIPAPQNVTTRHMEIRKDIWSELVE